MVMKKTCRLLYLGPSFLSDFFEVPNDADPSSSILTPPIARIKETVAGLSKAFKDMDLGQAKTLSIQLQYWIRIKNVIRDWAAGKPIVADHV